VVGVVLSGTLDDGTAGLAIVKRHGGVTIVQDPKDALYAGMPRSAIESVEPDYIAPLLDIAPLLVSLTQQPVAETGAYALDQRIEPDTAEMRLVQKPERHEKSGRPSEFSCPDCGGVLWEVHEGEVLRFQCRIDHRFSPDSLWEVQSEALDEALWTALRALEENAALARRLTARAHERNHPSAAARFDRRAQEAERHAASIRRVLLHTKAVTPEDLATTEQAHQEQGVGEPQATTHNQALASQDREDY
jgi:two-component system chemotaxis response regulator CheB